MRFTGQKGSVIFGVLVPLALPSSPFVYVARAASSEEINS